jgi:hypothetical protein
MSRTTITLPEDLVDELDAYRPDGMSHPAFFRDVVLPALAGDHVEVSVDGALAADVVAQLERIEGKIDDNRSQIPGQTVRELETTLR